MERYWN